MELITNPSYADYNSGIAPYFRGQIKGELTNILKKQGRDLYSEGYKIYTTIDYEAQKEAEKAVFEHMSFLQKVFKKHGEVKHLGQKITLIANYAKRQNTKKFFLTQKEINPK